MLGKNQRSSRPQMGHMQLYTQNSSTVYSGKTEKKPWFQASGTW